MDINKINVDLISFLNTGISRKYQEEKWPYYDEDDLVSDVHTFLKQQISDSPAKVFREYPVHMPAPLRLTQKAYDNLSTNGQILSNQYHKTKSGYYEPLYGLEGLIKDNPFRGFDPKIDKKYNRVYEPKYFDLVVINDYHSEEPDELIVPGIVMEFKYEVAEMRRGNDLRKNLTLPKNNTASIKHDLDALDFYCRSNQGSIGFFVFLDEASDGKYYKKFVPKEYKDDSNPPIPLNNASGGCIWVRTYNC